MTDTQTPVIKNPVTEKVWYAIYTRSRNEKVVAREFEKQEIEYYLPLVVTLRQWSDRKKKVVEPLIRSYIFVHIREKQYLKVLQTQGVVKAVCFGGKPVPIPGWQIENLKLLLGTDLSFKHEICEFAAGEEVTIKRGSLNGLRGTILQVRGRHKLIISISALNYCLTIDIGPGWVEK